MKAMAEKPASERQRNLRDFLEQLKARLPRDFHCVERQVAPAHFEVTALLQHLENERRFPVLFFENPLDMEGKPSAFPLLSNVFATRQRCALALGMEPALWIAVVLAGTALIRRARLGTPRLMVGLGGLDRPSSALPQLRVRVTILEHFVY